MVNGQTEEAAAWVLTLALEVVWVRDHASDEKAFVCVHETLLVGKSPVVVKKEMKSKD